MTPSSYGRRALNGEARKVRSARKGTRHNTILNAAYALGTLVPEHVPEHLVRAVLTEAARVTTANAIGTDPLTDQEISDTIRDGIEAGILNPREVPVGYTGREDALADLARIAEAWHQTPMGGWEGRRCKQVFPAVLETSRELGGPKNVPLPLNKLSILASITATTVSKALSDLVEAGWLTKKKRGGPGRSARYDVHAPTSHPVSRTNTETTLYQPHKWQQVEAAMIGHDASRPGCLGATGIRIFSYLTESVGEWLTQAEVARSLGVHPGTVGRHVKEESWLITTGLVERDRAGRLRTSTAFTLDQLDLAARAAGTLGDRDRAREVIAARYQEEGFLDNDLHWINAADGSRGAKATWLEAEGAAARSPRSLTGEERRRDSR